MTFLKKSTPKKSKSPFKYSIGGMPPANPLDYKMKTFEKEGEKEVNIPFIKDVPQLKVPEGFTEKKTDTVSAPITVGGAPLPSAKQILEKEKIPTAFDVLKTEKIKSPKELLSQLNIPAPKDIIEQEKQAQLTKGAGGQVQQAIESDLKKKEEEYLKNLDWKNLSTLTGDAKYETKFGTFKPSEITYAGDQYGAKVNGNKYASELFLPGNFYAHRYIPEEVLFKGMRVGDDLYLNGAFLQKDHWNKFLEKAQYMEISPDKVDKSFSNYSGRGFVIKNEDFNELFPKNSWGVLNYKTTSNFAGYHGDVVGLVFDEEKNKLVYATRPQGQSQLSYIHLTGNKNNPYEVEARGEWIEYRRKDTAFGKLIRGIPIIGDPLVDLATKTAEAFAKVPFGPEIAYALSGGNAYVYAAFTSLKMAGQGAPLEDRAKGAAMAFATASISQKLPDYSKGITDQFVKAGFNQTAAAAAGSAITYATFNGAMAAITGGDIKQAMGAGAVSGALGGAISVNAKEITSTILGGSENVTSLSKTLGMQVGQLEGVVAGSLHRASFAATRGEDFGTIFKNSLIESGFSTVVTNQVAASLDKTLDKDKRAAIIKNTQLITNTVARAAVRGQDIDVALKRIQPQLVSTTVKGVMG